MNKPDIKYLFEPKNIAVIGASSRPGKIGYTIVENIVGEGFTGTVYPINPGGGEILGLTMIRDIELIEEDIDVAVISIPAAAVYDAVVKCARKHVKFLTIISSGFSEVGDLEEERRIVRLARENGMRILGPNIFGHYSARVSLNATFGPRNIRAGNVAIVTQSGALGIAMIGKTAVQNIGLSAIISVGNKGDIDEADLLEYLIKQDETKIILMYIEGIQQGERLVRVLKLATRVKPVVVIKSGRSKRGAVAAASHTGSLAGTDEIFDAVMRQCGVLRAESVQEALEWCRYLSATQLPSGLNTVIVTNGGGVGVMATDACEKYNVPLFSDHGRLQATFESVTPGFGSTKNPIDLTGQASGVEYRLALEKALADPDIHAVLALYCETSMMSADQLSDLIRSVYQEYKLKRKPVLFSIFGGVITEQTITDLNREAIPVYRDVYEAVSCLGAQFSYYRHQTANAVPETAIPINPGLINEIILAARKDNRQFLLADEGQAVLNEAGLVLPKSGIARSIHDAVTLADSLGYPVVMKVVSRDILHKSDVGGVLLDLENREEVLDGYQTIIHNCKAFRPNVLIEGIEIVEQIPPGMEVIIGGRRDRAFGPILMFGLGGIYVEVMKDVSFRALPLNRSQIRSMIKETRSYPLLLGVRGEARKDIDEIVEVMVKVGTILEACPDIADIEINPLMVFEQGQGVKPVDVRIMLTEN